MCLSGRTSAGKRKSSDGWLVLNSPLCKKHVQSAASRHFIIASRVYTHSHTIEPCGDDDAGYRNDQEPHLVWIAGCYSCGSSWWDHGWELEDEICEIDALGDLETCGEKFVHLAVLGG
jgi:hypothetical protein